MPKDLADELKIEGAKPRRNITKAHRARMFHFADYRCQMCGRSVAWDGITLDVDHKIPADWGGATEGDNLWALCSECNEGRRPSSPALQTSASGGPFSTEASISASASC